jgi:hypothetical protein
MKMEKGNEKYDKVLEMLRKSEPALTSADEIAEKVLKTISKRELKHHNADLSEVLDFMFSWTYNVWVRRSLITAAAVMVIVFIFQQGVILSQINQLSRQINTSGWDASSVNTRYLNNSTLMFRFKGKLFPAGKTSVSDEKVEELLRSIDNLKKEYKDLHELIENDPELKRLIEKRLSEIDGSKTKL